MSGWPATARFICCKIPECANVSTFSPNYSIPYALASMNWGCFLSPVFLRTMAFRTHSPFILLASVPFTIRPMRAKPLDSQTSRSWVLPLQVGVRNKTRTKEAQRELLFEVLDEPEDCKSHYRSSWQILFFLYSNPNEGQLPLEPRHRGVQEDHGQNYDLLSHLWLA